MTRVIVTLRRYRMVTRAKPVNWPGVRWAAVDDARLLVGVMEHGLGNWDSIRDDPHLNMGNKVVTGCCKQHLCIIYMYVLIYIPQILSAEKSRKPQASHLLRRVEYLLKLIVVEAKARSKKVSMMCTVDRTCEDCIHCSFQGRKSRQETIHCKTCSTECENEERNFKTC